ncbi:MAG TPA: hypothetical protein VMZ91_01930 [Candidatus Paceibacterota bacterium]|nr:hypothetical protein [Candidatus Paceibacterota bacterium]
MIDPSAKKRVKEIFSDWLEIQDTRKELTRNANDLRKEASDILSVKITKVTKIFNFMKKLYEDGDDELSELVDIIEEMKD